MPMVGMGRATNLLSTHNGQLSEHGINSAFVSPLLNTVAMSATTIGQAMGAISSSTSNLPPTALPIPASMAAPSKQLRPDVVCPLPNLDGSACRKRCSGTFAYRSICEHIRRAHPEHWIPKLPASAESFHKMIQTPPLPRRIAVYESPSSTGGTQSSMNRGMPRRTTTGSGQRSRAKVPKSKPSSDDQDLLEVMSSQSSSPESHSQVTSSTLVEAKELLAHDILQQSVPSETVSCFLFLSLVSKLLSPAHLA
ncbi:hypothetical protein EV426DRAFT_396170 [Tirmania nivea]|nr:hypothetical protein EV426DRAFT_396170 [Tirmania nivea]